MILNYNTKPEEPDEMIPPIESIKNKIDIWPFT